MLTMRSIALLAVTVLVGTACGAASGPPSQRTAASTGPAAASPVRDIKIAYNTGSPTIFAVYLATQHGLFAKNGLRVVSELTKNSTIAISALVSGDVQFAVTSASTGILADARTNAKHHLPLVLVGSLESSLPYTLVISNSIKNNHQICGKSIGVGTPDSADALAARLLLQKVGVNPACVRFVPLGSITEQIPALAKGLVSALAVQAGVVARAAKTGHAHAVTALDPTRAPYAYGVVWTTRTELARHSADVLHFLQALHQAFVVAQSDRSAADSAFKAAFKVPVPTETITESYQAYAERLANVSLVTTKPMFNGVVSALVSSGKKVGVAYGDVVDNHLALVADGQHSG